MLFFSPSASTLQDVENGRNISFKSLRKLPAKRKEHNTPPELREE
jgi:hypothetical protein